MNVLISISDPTSGGTQVRLKQATGMVLSVGRERIDGILAVGFGGFGVAAGGF